MPLSALLAKHIKEVYFGGNWTAVNLKDTLDEVDWKMATKKEAPFHSIAELVYHMNYFVLVVLKVLKGGALQGNDAVSFDCPPILSQKDWEVFKKKIWSEVDEFALLLENLTDEKMTELIGDPKYGSYERNIMGISEHCHYHLGQINFLKKLLTDSYA